jgi:acetyltransferase-like isoleucine patch superfamily enzyme
VILRLAKFIFRPLYLFLRKKISLIFIIAKRSDVKIGSDVTILNSDIGRYVYFANRSKIYNCSFGDYSYCGENTALARVTVGNFTCIGPGVTIGLGEHPLNGFVSIHPAFYSTAAQVGRTFTKEQLFNELPKATKIGSDVWIGANVTIPGGVTIGNGAVIASGAVVVKDVEPFSIVGGVPAKKIRMRFEKEEIELLEKTKWWNKSDKWIENNVKRFMSIDDFSKDLNL